MPKQKTPKGAAATAASEEITDSRFTNFETDPRFRLPSKKHTRTKIDKRFSRMLKDEDFSNSAKVDRYGRKLSSSGKKKALEKLYVPDEEEEQDVEVEEDEVVEKELKRVEGYDPARGGGFSSSEDEEDDDEDGGVEIEELDETEFPDMQAEQAGVEMGEVSSRFAVVNLDWDNIKSADLMAVFSSFVRPGGKIHKISIYPSEFGKERMEREELEGPPKEIFAQKQEEESSEPDSEDDEDDEELDEKIKKDLQQEDEGQDFDGAALRQYQLERLRYYYAVVVCSDEQTAQHIYESTDGTEYLSSANFFDLRFIPDGTEFEDKPRDECDAVPSSYKPTEFVTDALQHSKVKLTWDMDPEEATRKDAIKRAFSGSRTELNENDLRAYLGSDSEDDEEEAEEADAPKFSKKELARQKMRAALGLADEPTKSSKKTAGPVGDMEITFTAGLSSNDKGKGSVFENEPIKEETTAEAYVRKEKERKARRKEKARAKREGHDPEASADEAEPAENAKEDLGFDDPFFATDEVVKEKASKSIRKEERMKKREAKAKEAAARESQRAELELLMQDNSTEAPSNLAHFDINEIARAEKLKKKKGKKSKVVDGGKRGGLQEGFEIDVGDERFSKLFESHEFAIDPSNPKFKGTEGMKKLLEEGRRKRGVEGDEEVGEKKKSKKRKVEGREGKGELSGLVEMVKKKAKK
jgi:NUC153 domain